MKGNTGSPSTATQTLQNQRDKNITFQDHYSILEEPRVVEEKDCMLAGKGSRNRCRDKAGLKRCYESKLTIEEVVRSQVTSRIAAAGCSVIRATLHCVGGPTKIRRHTVHEFRGSS